jgi:hypothetical protein
MELRALLVAHGTEGLLLKNFSESNFSFCRPNISHILLYMKLKSQLHYKWPNDKNVTPIKALNRQICFNRMRVDSTEAQETSTSNCAVACVAVVS